MVKNSLKLLLDKFPYFLNKNSDSNFYKVEWVNNESLKQLYNDLFLIYESFHLNKRLLVWKEQEENYNYNVCFVANYPNLKSVKIYKNDELIYLNEYNEEDAVDTFQYCYKCWYGKSNIPETKVFICTECEELYSQGLLHDYEQIYFSQKKPSSCNHCNNTSFYESYLWRCDTCGQIYFSLTPPEGCPDCNTSSFTQVHAYRCNNCGQIYIGDEAPETCDTCGVRANINLNELLTFNDDEVTMYDNRNTNPDEIIIRPSNNRSYTSLVAADELSTVIVEPYLTSVSDDESFDDDSLVPVSVDDDEILQIPIPIIPTDKFIIEVETYDEYKLVKGFPEKDEPTYDKDEKRVIDEFDHDLSLDEFGALNNIPRKTYIPLVNTDLYHLTEPPYNDRLTEDDYHYMKRIIEYNLRLFNTPAPILEIWKLYGLPATMLNRERLLLKLFDITRHQEVPDLDKKLEFNKYYTVEDLVECWQPEPWEHKDKFYECSQDLGVYFFAKTDTIRPVPWQDIHVNFRFTNSLGKTVTPEYYIDVYHSIQEADNISGETPIASNYTDSSGVIRYDILNQGKINILRFEAYSSESNHNSDNLIGSVEIPIIIRGCDDGDWYVKSSGNDETGDGSKTHPFKTLTKALSVVSSSQDLIIVQGSLELNNEDSIPYVNTNCTIMGCDNGQLYSNYKRQFFHLTGGRDVTLRLVNISLKNNELASNIRTIDYVNSNSEFDNYETVIIHGGATILTATLNTTRFFPKDRINITGKITNKDGNGLPNQELTLKLEDGTVLGTFTTDESGNFDEWIDVDLEYTSDSFKLYLVYDNENYFGNTQEWTVSLIKPAFVNVTVGTEVQLVSTGHTPGTVVNFYDETGTVIGTATADSNGNATLTYETSWGATTIYTLKDGSQAINCEWFIETFMDIDSLSTQEFVSEIEFLPSGEFNCTTKTVNVIDDIDDLLLTFTMNDDLRFNTTSFKLDRTQYTEEELNSNELTSVELDILKQAITSITVDNYGNLKINRL